MQRFQRFRLPPDSEGGGNHAGWDSSCAGILIPRLSEESESAQPAEIEARALYLLGLSNRARYLPELIPRKRVEKWIKEKHRRERGLRELNRAAVISDAADDVRVHLTPVRNPKLGIERERPLMRGLRARSWQSQHQGLERSPFAGFGLLLERERCLHASSQLWTRTPSTRRTCQIPKLNPALCRRLFCTAFPTRYGHRRIVHARTQSRLAQAKALTKVDDPLAHSGTFLFLRPVCFLYFGCEWLP